MSFKSTGSNTIPLLGLLVVLGLLLTSFTAILQYRGVAVPVVQDRFRSRAKTVWGGWHSIERIFIFGDSWSDTSFDIDGAQPAPEQPMGNPPFPSDGDFQNAKWPVYLTAAYNDSLLQTYCFARSGACVDHELLRTDIPDFVEEVEKDFIPGYAKYDLEVSEWTSPHSLFIIFLGINDSIRTAAWNNTQEVQTQLMNSYLSLIETLYSAGARNFLLMNVPPIGRGPTGNREIADSIQNWNKRLINVAAEFRYSYPDVTVHEFDTFRFFNRVMDDPTSFPETAIYKNLTDECSDYTRDDIQFDWFSEECGVRRNQYLWRDALHPTSPVHEAMASQIAELLRGRGMFGRTDESGYKKLRRA